MGKITGKHSFYCFSERLRNAFSLGSETVLLARSLCHSPGQEGIQQLSDYKMGAARYLVFGRQAYPDGPFLDFFVGEMVEHGP